MFDLSGTVAVVTGGGRGIGTGIVHALARAGASVVVAGRTPEHLDATVAKACELGSRGLAVPTDITRPEDLDHLVGRTIDEFGRIDTWVNNAGSARDEDVSTLLDMTEEQWDAVVDLNLKWTFFASQRAARAMTHGGSIINISSRTGLFPAPMTGQYGAAKAGLNALTATMAVEWGHLGIRVNAIAPGVVLTETNTAPGGAMGTEGRRRRQIDTVPLGRLGEVDDVGPLCVFLASAEAAWMSGDVLRLDGGSKVPIGYLGYLRRIGDSKENARP